MKKVLFLIGILFSIAVLINCTATKKAAAPKMNYETDIKPLIVANCSPCHIPDKGGRKKAYDTYAPIKADIDEIVRRIELQPGERGFMPFKGKRLSDSTINAFKQWKADGMLEK